jgi:hypothetical protein
VTAHQFHWQFFSLYCQQHHQSDLAMFLHLMITGRSATMAMLQMFWNLKQKPEIQFHTPIVCLYKLSRSEKLTGSYSYFCITFLLTNWWTKYGDSQQIKTFSGMIMNFCMTEFKFYIVHPTGRLLVFGTAVHSIADHWFQISQHSLLWRYSMEHTDTQNTKTGFQFPPCSGANQQ